MMEFLIGAIIGYVLAVTWFMLAYRKGWLDED
jgi:hypothetical protein